MREKERRQGDEGDGSECKVGSKSLSGTAAFIGESAIFFAGKTITFPNRTCTSKTRAASRGWRGTPACRGRRLRWLMEDNQDLSSLERGQCRQRGIANVNALIGEPAEITQDRRSATWRVNLDCSPRDADKSTRVSRFNLLVSIFCLGIYELGRLE